MKTVRFIQTKLLFGTAALFVAMGASAQGGNTPAIADNTPINLPFSASGTTVGAGDDVNSDPTPGVVTIDGGNDYFYYFCAPTTGIVYATLIYNGAATPQIFPSLQAFTDLGLTTYAGTPGNAACTQMADPNLSNTANTIGFPISVTAGQCYYVMVDNADYNTTSYNYTLSLTYTATNSTMTLQPGCTNMGFDNGTTSGWVGNWGHSVVNGAVGAATPSYTPVYTTLNQGHHNVTTGGTDPYTGAIQQVCPLIPGNTNSIRLGDGANACFGGAQIMQKYSVTASNALLTYYYAAVMQDAGSDHQNYEQPFFKIEALDCSGNPITCGNYLVTGGPGIPGFMQIGTSAVYYKDWAPVLLDLTPYIGSCITIKFTVGDCSRGAHFAYAYLDATCGPVQISTPPAVCQFNSTTLTAPTGGAAYSWVETSNPGTVLGTANTLTITPTTTGTFTYQCVISSVTGCNTTVQSTVTVQPTPQITVTDPPPVCTPSTVDITSSSVVNISSGTGSLSYFQDAACTIPLSNPNALASGGTFYIKITNANGCYDVKPVTVTINTSPTVDVTTANQSICTGQSVNLNATVGPAAGNVPLSFTNTDDVPIPDGAGAFVGSPITVSGVTAQTPGVLPIVSVCLNIAHTWDEDLDLVLQCPDGTQIYLASAAGADGDNFTGTCFVPTGTSITSGTAPFSGSFTPMQPFTTLNSCTINGTWTLMAADFTTGDSGTLLDWTITFNSYTAAPTYVWSPTTAMTNSTTLTPTVSPTATTTYTFTGTSPTGGCTASDPVTITVNPLPTATISGTATVCQNATAPTITFTGANGVAPYIFTYTINGGTNQTVSSGTGNTATLTQATSTAGTFVYNLVSVTCTGGCSQAQSGSATVVVNPTPSATISGDATICEGGTAPTITFIGSGAAAPYTFTYNLNGGTDQTISSGAGNTATLSASTSASGTFVFNLVSVATATGCSQLQTGSATVTVGPLPTATISGTATICQNGAAPTITFTGADGVAPYVFTYNINGGTNQTVSSGTGNTATVTQATSAAGTFVYNLVSVSCTGGCSQTQSGSATITVNATPSATISGDAVICEGGTAPTITFTGSGAAAPYTFTYNINGGANQTISSGAGNTATLSAPTSVSGTFVFNLVSVSAPNGCSQSQTGSATVTVGLLPTASVSGSTTVCQNAASPQVTFTGANGVAPYTFSYTFNGGATQTISSSSPGTTATISIPTGTPGTFTYSLVGVSTPNGCSQAQTESVSIVVNAAPTAASQADTSLCAGASTNAVNFISTPTGATFGWTNSNTSIGLGANGIGSIPSFTTTNAGSSPISGTITYAPTLNGCVGPPQTFTITVSNTPASYAGADVGLCENSSGSQIGTTAQAGLSYSWSPATGLSNPNGSNTSASTATAGTTTYTVTTTNAIGCFSTDDVVVTINPLPDVSFVPDVTSGCAPLEVRFTNTSSASSVNCEWSFGDGGTDNGCGGVAYTFNTPGIWDVTLTVTDANGCQNSLTENDLISVYPNVYASFAPDHYEVSELDPSFYFTNFSENATHYSWTFGDGGTSTATNPNHTYEDVAQGYTITLTATNDAGCSAVAVQHVIIDEELIFYVPNVFTPDGDEFNNTFYPVFTSGFDEMSYTMYIFDRWGEIIFESHNWNIGWDGTYHGKMCQEGVYTWKILVKEKVRDKHHEYHGHTTLLK